ncbi:MAG: HAD family hydrolase [Candidatus Omnitrophica bacterium]|nr:HAD family hydrolase [Candidatus Omnitrophota bacterium]
MKDIQLIVFDLDGTLVDAYRAIIRSFNYTMQRLGYPRQSDLIIRRAVGWGDGSLLEPFLKKKDLKEALSIYRMHHQAALLKGSRVFPWAKKALRRLKSAKYKLAVATNRPTKFTGILMDHLGLTKYFNYVLCSDVLKRGKPDPEILRKIMQRFNLNPKQTIYVGDMNIDVQTGRRAGVKTVIVATGSSSRREIKKEKPYRIIGKIRNLVQLLS